MYEPLRKALDWYAQNPDKPLPDELLNSPPQDGIRYNSKLWKVRLSKTQELAEYPELRIISPLSVIAEIPTEYQGNDAQAFKDLFSSTTALLELKKYSVFEFMDIKLGHRITPEAAIRSVSKISGPKAHKNVKTKTPPKAEDEEKMNRNLKNGVWFNTRTYTEFPINDAKHPPGPDAPLLALGNNLARVLTVSPKTDAWYATSQPPMRPLNADRQQQYVQLLRQYLKKLAIQLIEQDSWILFWRGYLYTNGRDLNFRDIVKHSDHFAKELFAQYQPSEIITVMDANNGTALRRTTWEVLKGSSTLYNSRTAQTPPADRRVLDVFLSIGEELLRECPNVIRALGSNESLSRELLTAIVESYPLHESLTYNQMLTATADYWRTRLKTVQDVQTDPPAFVMLKDGTVDLSFNFESRPSTEGKPHRGYVKFIPERGKPNVLNKLKTFLGDIGTNIKKFLGRKVPPKILIGSNLRKLLVEVSCDCKDFKYRMSHANVRHGVTTQAGRTDNGKPPVQTNPGGNPGFCKHILATVRYLTPKTEIEVSKEWTKEQQDWLARDQLRFYEQIQDAPAAPEEKPEEEKPEKDKPADKALANLPPPPAPAAAAVPPAAMTPAAPITPNYSSNQ